jgi:hypothetical protein
MEREAELSLETELVLYPYSDYAAEKRLRIECAPSHREIARAHKTKEYGGVVPGRKIFPEDRDIPLKVYNEQTKTTSEAVAMVRVTFQELARTGTGKITNIEYRIIQPC